MRCAGCSVLRCALLFRALGVADAPGLASGAWARYVLPPLLSAAGTAAAAAAAPAAAPWPAVAQGGRLNKRAREAGAGGGAAGLEGQQRARAHFPTGPLAASSNGMHAGRCPLPGRAGRRQVPAARPTPLVRLCADSEEEEGAERAGRDEAAAPPAKRRQHLAVLDDDDDDDDLDDN